MLTAEPAAQSPEVVPETVVIISEALRSKFGKNALAVARIQQKQAGADSISIWDEIVKRLQG